MRRSTTLKPNRPLLVTGDPLLLDELLKVTAIAGVEPEVAADLVAARRLYTAAPLVILGPDVVPGEGEVQLPPRPGLIVASRVYNDETAWNLGYDLGAEHVIVLPLAQKWLAGRLRRAERRSESSGRVLTVIGGRGGAGASVLAAGLCVTAVRQGYRTLLVDADPLGGGADLLFGWEKEHGLRWGQLADTGGSLDSSTMVGALPNRGDLVLLSCDRGEEHEREEVSALPADLMQSAIEAGRDDRDLVVVDLPRRFDDASECALRLADRAFLVVTPELRATAAAARVAGATLARRKELSVVVRQRKNSRANAARIAKTLDLPLAGGLRSEPRLVSALESGRPPASDTKGPLAVVCHQILKAALA